MSLFLSYLWMMSTSAAEARFILDITKTFVILWILLDGGYGLGKFLDLVYRINFVVVVHLHHLLLTVIIVPTAPPPAFSRQHCRRRHHFFVDFAVTAPIRPVGAIGLTVLLKDSSNSPFCLPPPPDGLVVVVHLHHLLLAVIVVAIAPPPAFARQHCRRRHHYLLVLPPPTLIALSTARSRCSQRNDIAVAVITATSSSPPNDNVQHRDLNGQRRRNGRRQRLPPLTATTLTSPLSRAPLLPPT